MAREILEGKLLIAFVPGLLPIIECIDHRWGVQQIHSIELSINKGSRNKVLLKIEKNQGVALYQKRRDWKKQKGSI